MKFISFWYDCNPSKSNYYENCSKNLKKQLNFFGYDYYIEHIDIPNPNYKTINFHKPKFIIDQIKKFNESVIWIDIDCSLMKPVDELKVLDCDIGFFMRDKRYDVGQSYYEIGTPHASVIFFNNTKKSLEFIEPWKQICENAKLDPQIKQTEHAYLIDYYRQNYKNYNICKLENYCTSSQFEINKYKVYVGISQAGINYDNGMCGWENKG